MFAQLARNHNLPFTLLLTAVRRRVKLNILKPPPNLPHEAAFIILADLNELT